MTGAPWGAIIHVSDLWLVLLLLRGTRAQAREEGEEKRERERETCLSFCATYLTQAFDLQTQRDRERERERKQKRGQFFVVPNEASQHLQSQQTVASPCPDQGGDEVCKSYRSCFGIQFQVCQGCINPTKSINPNRCLPAPACGAAKPIPSPAPEPGPEPT